MRPALFHAALRLTLFTPALAQDRFFAEIPAEEAVALSQIVEDDPIPTGGKGGDWISPVYSQIYQVALPIPPVKQPKQ
jgi:bilirubin oxidase